MPAIIAVAIYAVLFISGTAISKTIPKSISPLSTMSESSELSASASTPTPTITPTMETSSPTIQFTSLYVVKTVIDGDTIQIDVAGKKETIRLIGIDSPETVDPRKPVQCFGTEASKKAKELLSGKKVGLEADASQGERDKYNRLLRYVFLEDGTHINLLMIREGFAHEYTYQSNPYKYQSEFIKAEQSAREGKKGLWADNVCVTPTLTTGPTSTVKPTSTPTKIVTTQNTPTPVIYIPPPAVQQTTQTATGGYTCNCSKVCGAMTSCEEAYFQLNNCGCSKRDGDSDGIPCEEICSEN